MKFDLEKFKNGHPARCGNEPAHFVAYVPELGVDPVFFRTPASTGCAHLLRCNSAGAREPLEPVILDDPVPKRRPYRNLSEIPVEHWFRRTLDGCENFQYRVSALRPNPLGVAFCTGTSFWSPGELAEIWEHAPTVLGPWEPCTVEET